MPGTYRRYLAVVLALTFASVPVFGDDKDLLKGSEIAAPPNLLIVFGNSQTMTQTLTFTGDNFSTFDGDADSPGSKLGAAKRVIKQFVQDRHTTYNIGLTTFSHNPNVGSIEVTRKHWVYAPVAVDFPAETWGEPIGTLERWGVNGEGPCTNKTTPRCDDRSPGVLQLPNGNQANLEGSFFGALPGTASTTCGSGGTACINLSNTERIRVRLTSGKYGDAFTDGSLTTYTLGGTPPRSVQVTKEYQTKSGNTWTTQATTPNGNPGSVIVPYVAVGSPVPVDSGSPDPTLFYPTGALDSAGNSIAGGSVGFLNDQQNDFSVSANCAGWEFQTNNTQVPLVRIPRDYLSPDPTNPNVCLQAQDSYPCVKRLLRPQAYIQTYDQTGGAFTTSDPDNPGYTGTGSKYADGCDPNLLGASDQGDPPGADLDVVENTVILTTRNGSQAPIKNLLENIYAYFTDPKFDSFKNGVREDDPNAACRNSAVILIYDNFNGCQNDSCTFLTNKILTPLRQIGIPVYVIGFGASAAATANTGVCIAHNTGAILPDGTDGYFPVTTAAQLNQALNDIADFVLEGQKGFVASTVSTSQSAGDQMVYLATFNAASERSIWDGRVNAYRLDAGGKIQIGVHTIRDANDPFNNVPAVVPSNDPSSLKWNVGQNLAQTNGTGATNSSAVLGPNVAKLANGTYQDNSNDTASTIPTYRYPGRKIVFSLPESYADPVTQLPIPPGASSPEVRYDLTASTGASWWPALKALLGPQTAHPGTPAPLDDTDATESLRFIWGDRDAVMALPANATVTKKYTPPNSSFQLKLGDIFHSSPVLVAQPNEFPYFAANLNDYQTFRNTFQHRRRLLFFGANDGLFHAVDAGGWNRTPSECLNADGTQGECFDSGTGAEVFAYAPRATMQQFKPLKDAEGPQTKRDEWTVDGAPSAADVFIDSVNNGTATAAERAWHTVIISGVREGSPFEGTDGTAPANSLGSYFALDVTQPDQLVSDGAGGFASPNPTSFNSPKCLNVAGDASCARDWPQVLWEISDVDDLDASGAPGFGYGDMGESWSKPAIGRIRVCTANCGNTTTPFPVTEDRYVAIFGGGFDRERLNRRGNWLYMIDVETGHVVYRANSSCGINTGAGCTPTYFASVPSEPAAIDASGDGYLDVVYVADQKGQLWRIDLSDLRMGSAPANRWGTQIDPSAGSATPFLVFQAPQPVAPAIDPNYPVYYRPTAVYLGYNVAGKPALGLAFGSGDRDDILSKTFTGSMNFKQRFYYVVDKNNSTTRFESDLLDITSPTAPSVTTVPANGWFLELALGERVITDSISINGVIFFTTFNPNASVSGPNPCGNGRKCALAPGTARLYRVLYSTGNPYSGTDRGETQTQGGFLSEPVFYQSKDQQGNIFYTTENSVKTETAPGGKKTSVKGWKERSRRP